MDCFAEPVIGPRFARTRWLAMPKAKKGARRRPFNFVHNSPVVASVVPTMPAADAARSVIGVDDPAVGVVIIAVVGVVAAIEEAAVMESMEVGEAETAAMEGVKSTTMETTAVPTSATMPAAAKASTVKAAAVESTTMESAAAVKPTTAMTAADPDQRIGGWIRRRRRAWRDQRHRLRALSG